LKENLEIAADLLGLTSAANVILEIEVGVVGGEEDGVSPPPTASGPGGSAGVPAATGSGLLTGAPVAVRGTGPWRVQPLAGQRRDVR